MMQKHTFRAIAFMALAGCSGAASGPSPAARGHEGASPSQLRAFEQLEATTKQPWVWIQNGTLKTPMHLSTERVGEPVLAKNEDVVARTLTILEANKALFNMRAPARELTLENTVVDELGMTHARFQQTTHGVAVAGAELLLHYDDAGRMTSIDADYVADLDDLDVEPALREADARSIASAAIRASTRPLPGGVIDETSLEPEEVRLVVHAPEGAATARLAYELKVHVLDSADPAIWVTTIDAKTGAILHRYNDLKTIQGQGAGVLGDVKPLEVTASGGSFVLMDAASGIQIRTFTAGNQQTTPGIPVISATQNSWDTGVPGAGAAVDAHFNAAAVFKYYKEKHARNAIDGAGGAMLSTVHFGQSFENAAWDGRGMLYGDGGQIFRPLSVSLDVVGHEFTHGVTDKTSKLRYENQSGALNEAISDIFGAFIEHAVSPDAVKNWTIGETVQKDGKALRDLKDPASVVDPQPGHMTKFVNTQQDNGGVHINSGIINNAAYLMTVGGVNPVSKIEVKTGIGWEKSEKLWYRANTIYFKETTTFPQAAQGVLQAAKDLGFTEIETNIVDCAFKSTGVAQGACGPMVTVQSTSAPGAGAPTAGATTASGDDTAKAGGAVDGVEAPATKPATRRRAIVTEEGGCNASGGDVDVSPIAAVLGLVFGFTSRRRKKPGQNDLASTHRRR
jgi:bacillolysin